MSFVSALNMYCEMIPCHAGEIAAACGVSPSALSRYRSGQRMPTSNSAVLPQMAKGLASLLRKYGIDVTATDRDVLLMLASGREEKHASAARFSARLDQIMRTLGIRNKDLADAVGIDASYVSRIRHGARNAHDKRALARQCARLAVKKCLDEGMVDALTELDCLSVSEVSAALVSDDSRSAFMDLLIGWLIGVRLIEIQTSDIAQALHAIDGFDYWAAREQLLADPYWADIDCGKADAAREDSRFFYGMEGAREAELEFIRELLSAPNPGTVTICSNLATEALVSDREFLMHHQSGLMRFLERGGRIDILHDLRRPFSEILSGLQYCLPLYMTGRVSAYFVDYVPSDALRLAVYVSDTCAYEGEDADGDPELRRCHLTKRPQDIQHYRRRADAVRKIARPFLELWRLDDPAQLQALEKTLGQQPVLPAGTEVAAGRFSGLRIMTYPEDCVVVLRTDDPKVYVRVCHERAKEILARIDEVLEHEE